MSEIVLLCIMSVCTIVQCIFSTNKDIIIIIIENGPRVKTCIHKMYGIGVHIQYHREWTQCYLLMTTKILEITVNYVASYYIL